MKNRQQGKIAGCNDPHGYSVITIKQRHYFAHRLAWLYVYGVWPEKEIDHINRVRNDNRIQNLREASHEENGRNISQPRKRVGLRGTTYSKRRHAWVAQIGVKGRNLFLGHYNTTEDAHQAYLAAVAKYHGDFAVKELRS